MKNDWESVSVVGYERTGLENESSETLRESMMLSPGSWAGELMEKAWPSEEDCPGFRYLRPPVEWQSRAAH